MDIIKTVDAMSVDMYQRLKTAAETGKWPEGTPVGEQQRESALQLSMAYQSRHLNSNDILTIGSDGQIVSKSKMQLRKEFKQDNNDTDIVRFKNL